MKIGESTHIKTTPPKVRYEFNEYWHNLRLYSYLEPGCR